MYKGFLFPGKKRKKIEFETIKNSSDFRNLTDRGHRVNTEYFNLKISTVDSNANKIRLGFVINKKTGKAVVRNKIKRRLKEIFRNIKKTSNSSIDILLIAKKEINELSFEELKAEVMKNIKNII